MGQKYQLSGYTAGNQQPSNGIADRRGHCAVHDKTTWATRKIARRAAKKRHPESMKAPYWCKHTQGWHYGTLHASRDTYRGLTEDRTEEQENGMG